MARFVAWGGGASLALIVTDLLSVVWYPVLGPTRQFVRFIVMEPLLRFIMLLSLARTILTNTISWSGTDYLVKMSTGKVQSLTRS